MSKKPAKHSEKKKMTSASELARGWGKRRAEAPAIMIRPERHLIVTEGEKTEPLYFEEVRRRINNRFHGNLISVKIVGIGMNTESLLEEAKRIAFDDIDGYTHVWVVYDKDSFSDESFNVVVAKCEATYMSKTRFHATWSNESFELWYLLHYEYLQSALGREMYTEKLNRHLCGAGLGRYTKNRDDMFVALEGRLNTAVANAEKLEAINTGRPPAESCPGTKVHQLLQELLPYAKRKGEDN